MQAPVDALEVVDYLVVVAGKQDLGRDKRTDYAGEGTLRGFAQVEETQFAGELVCDCIAQAVVGVGFGGLVGQNQLGLHARGRG